MANCQASTTTPDKLRANPEQTLLRIVNCEFGETIRIISQNLPDILTFSLKMFYGAWNLG